jgi:hypothetical protein
MAQDLSLKKANALNALVAFCQPTIGRTAAIAEFVKELTDSGLLTGGANPITDADCALSPATAHLTAALVNSATAALGSVSLSTANATTLRQAAGGMVQPGS